MVRRFFAIAIGALSRHSFSIADCGARDNSSSLEQISDETSLLQVKQEVRLGSKRSESDQNQHKDASEDAQPLVQDAVIGRAQPSTLLAGVASADKVAQVQLPSGSAMLDSQGVGQGCPGCPGGCSGCIGISVPQVPFSSGIGYYNSGVGYSAGLQGATIIGSGVPPNMMPVAGVAPGLGSTVVTDSASVVVPGASGAYPAFVGGATPLVVQSPGIAAGVVPTLGSVGGIAVTPGAGGVAAMPPYGGIGVQPAAIPALGAVGIPYGLAAAEAAQAGTNKYVAWNEAAIDENYAAQATIQQAAAQNVAAATGAYDPGYSYYYPRPSQNVQHVHYHIVEESDRAPPESSKYKK